MNERGKEAGDDRQEARLRGLCAAADLPVPPPEALRRHVAELAARHDAREAPFRGVRGWLALGARPAAAAAGAALIAALGLLFVHRDRPQPGGPRPSLMVRVPQPDHVSRAPREADVFLRGLAAARPVAPASQAGQTADRRRSTAVGGPRSVAGGRRSPILAAPPAEDDVAFMNGDPTRTAHRWAALSAREWDGITARLRHTVQGGDDFVLIPFPQLAAASDGPIPAAVARYKQEAAIVDPRLSREVTLQFKGMALSDACERFHMETGIALMAGRSVADEKVTLLCRRTPLREVMRQMSRPFGYAWVRSGSEGEYRYELMQDLKSQLLEEELRNRDRNEALLALEHELDRYRPYLRLTPDEIVAHAKTAPPAEKKLLETLGAGSPRSGLGWGPIQMYFRLSSQELAALRAGETLYFSEGPRPGERPLPPELARGVLQSWRGERIRKLPDPAGRDRLSPTGTEDPDGVPISSVPELRASVTLTLDHSELGQYGLQGLSGYFLPGDQGPRRADASGPYVVGRSPQVLRPDNGAANGALGHDPQLRGRVTVALEARSPKPGARNPAGQPVSRSADGIASREPRASSGNEATHVTTADALEALHQATGMPVVSDFYTRLYEPETLSARNMSLFDTLNFLADRMRLRWSRDRGWLQFRSTSFYDDRLKEVPNRLLARWTTARRRQGMLTLEDLVEIAQLPDAQLRAEEMASGARELWGLAEWDLARNHLVLPNLRFLAQFTPAQRQEAAGTAGLPFARMTLAQQQGFLARAFPAISPGTNTPSPIPGLQSVEDLEGAALRVDYSQPGGFEWRPPGPTLLRWIVPSEPSPKARRVLRATIREKTREAALTALRQLDPQIRTAARWAAARLDARLETTFPADEAQIAPTDLELATIYMPGSANKYGVLIISSDSYGRSGWGG